MRKEVIIISGERVVGVVGQIISLYIKVRNGRFAVDVRGPMFDKSGFIPVLNAHLFLFAVKDREKALGRKVHKDFDVASRVLDLLHSKEQMVKYRKA
jgi:hypothetical protein